MTYLEQETAISAEVYQLESGYDLEAEPKIRGNVWDQ